MAGTGNLILKRGTKIPYETQLTNPILTKGMPAVQINGLSQTTNIISGDPPLLGPYAAKNYENRFWIGLESYGTGTPESITGVVPIEFAGTPSAADPKRPLWMGAEIRAFTPVGDLTNGATTTISSIVVVNVNNFKVYVSLTTGFVAGNTVVISGTIATGYFNEAFFNNTWLIGSVSTDGGGPFVQITVTDSSIAPTGTFTTTGSMMVGDGDAASTQYTILKADWERPSDLVLCTQQAIAFAPTKIWAQGNVAGGRKYIEYTVPDQGAKSYSGSITVASGVGAFQFSSGTSVYPPVKVGTTITLTNAGAYNGEFVVSASTQYVVTLLMPDETNGTDSTCNLAVPDPWASLNKQKIQLPTELPAVGQVLKVVSVLAGADDTNTINDNEYITWIHTQWGAVSGTGIDISSVDASTDTVCSVVLVGAQSTGNQSAFIDGALQYNSSTNALSAASFVGNLTGNASTATSASQVNTVFSNNNNSHYLTFVDSNNSTAAAESISTQANLFYNPSTSKLSVGTVAATVTGGIIAPVKLLPTANTVNTAFPVTFSSTTAGATDTTSLRYASSTSDSLFTFNPNQDGGTLYVKNIRSDNLYSTNQTIDNKTEIQTSGGTVELNSGLSPTGAPDVSADYGVIINRGSESDTQLRWNESSDRWEIVSVIDNLSITNITFTSGTGSGTGNDLFTVTCTGDKRQIVAGQYVQIKGVGTRTEYNGQWKVSTSTAPSGSTNIITIAEKRLEITSIVADGTKLTVTHPSHFAFVAGQSVTIRNTAEGFYNNTWIVTGTPTATTFELSYSGNNTPTVLEDRGPSNGGTVTGNVNDNYNTTSITYTNAKLSSQFAYPIVHTSAPTNNASPEAVAYTVTGGEPIQTIYNAKLVDVELQNLNMTGTWFLNATITSIENLNLTQGGLTLPYLNNNTTPDSWHEGVTSSQATRNILSNLPEGQIAYDIMSNRIKYTRGSITNTNEEIIGGQVGELVDTDATQTLTSKTLTSPTINTPSLTLSGSGNNTVGSLYYVTNGGSTSNQTVLKMGRTSTSMEMVNTDASQVLSNKTLANSTVFNTAGAGAYTLNNTTNATSRTITIPALSDNDTFVFLAQTQTLSNKTLANSTVFNTAGVGTYTLTNTTNANSRTIIIPALGANDTFVFEAQAQTLTNKTFTDATTLFQDDTTNSKKMNFELSGIAVSTTRILKIGDWDGTIVAPDSTSEGNRANKWLIESIGTSTTQPKWVNPDDVVVGGVKLRKETNSTNRFPILFGASEKNGAMGTWSSVVENSSTASTPTDVFLMADWGGTGGGTEDAGFYYSPGESEVAGQVGSSLTVIGGTLYAGFFAGYLDCGTY